MSEQVLSSNHASMGKIVARFAVVGLQTQLHLVRVSSAHDASAGMAKSPRCAESQNGETSMFAEMAEYLTVKWLVARKSALLCLMVSRLQQRSDKPVQGFTRETL